MRTDRRSEEIAIVGAPLRQVETDELRWRTRVARTGDDYRVTQDLIYLSYARDGETLVQGDVPAGISATLLIDQSGNLTAVQGLDRTAETLRSLVAPGKEADAAQIITTDALTDVVAARYQILFGETIGRPSAPGSTWTIENPQGSFVTARTVTVSGHEACGTATCARLKVDFKLDPKVISNIAVGIVKGSMTAAGEDPSAVRVKSSNYTMSGWMLVEPATMLSHGASLTEGGTVTVADSKQQEVTIQIKGKTDLTYTYGEAAPRTSSLEQERGR